MDIKEIYYGNNTPICTQFTENSRYAKLGSKWLSLYDKLVKSLDSEQRKLLDELTDTQGQQTSISNEWCYVQGFHDGAELILDMLHRK